MKKNKIKKISKKKIGKLMDFTILILIILGCLVFCVWQDNDVGVTKINYTNTKIPVSFDGYKIVQVSDLHNKSFGKNNSRLLELIRGENPNIIVITGDIIDRNKTNIPVAVNFVSEAVKIAPVYFISGNHEYALDNYESFIKELESACAVVLENEVQTITIGNESIDLIGLKDNLFNKEIDKKAIVDTSKNEFKILLSHRPELIDEYSQSNVDLVFSGHAHGGQIRLPIIGGLFSPGQGAFPKYTSGLYTVGETDMIVSRGLGNSIFPIRVFNRPEVVSLTLKSS